ncbi:unnamed protein product [Pelagomonas calceolata]|uniref:NADH:ubiquinone oxidoreductase intermediate-associated protein 30 domain-containing protein n=1 Tax=Pelagomonas calceolata TaxID=35677 RepID=A0A7S3ZVI1_9STRA|nr:unnamed protein product [Pelagomonas calceolata]|mmetsp:Transcript_14950/g.42410  ORF Transcript_14950/g.42410 Transcript_14950/m.42410 type:complete len:348 (-) Transcript_14950:97-1140(-)
MGREGSPTSVARDDMETATPSKDNDVNPLHIHVGDEDEVRLYWRKRQIRQKYCSLLCMLLFGFFIGFGTGAGIFIQKDWGSNDDDDSSPTTPDTILVADFIDGKPWEQTNDPVMGGQSTGAFTVSADGVGLLEGSVKIVKFLTKCSGGAQDGEQCADDATDDTDDATCPGGVCVRAPGFIKAEKAGTFPDISACSAFVISCKHYTGDPMGDYTGYRIGFGTQRAPEDLEPHRWSSGFKAPFQAGMVLTDVEIPFTAFSDDWDDATGEIIVSCADDQRVCPHASNLQDLQKLSIWGEGVEGNVHLEIHSIKAINCAGGAHTAATGSWSHAAATAASDESEDGGEPDDD